MNFSEMLLTVLSGSSSGEFRTPGVFDGIAMFFAAVGSGCFLATFFPFFLFIKNTRNTVGVNKTMFFMHLAVSVLFLFGAILLILEGFAVDAEEPHQYLGMIINGIIFTCLNATTTLCSFYIWWMKEKNCREAKSMGLTEQEHFEQVCCPAVREAQLKAK